jgi:uncharacterized protein YndB with AHSA1/START domain
VALAEQVEESLLVAAPADVVWRFLVDLRTWPLWWQGLVEATAENHKPLREGSRFVYHVQPHWLSVRLRAEVEVAREGKTLICAGRGLAVSRRVAFFLDPRAEGTRVTVRDSAQGVGTLLLRLVRQQPALAEMYRRSLRGLKRVVEAAV